MENKHIRESSHRFYTHHWKEFLPSVLSLISVSIIAVLPAFFVPSLLYLTLPLVFLPCALGMHLSINAVESRQGMPPMAALQGIPAYFSRFFFGCYRAAIGFAKSALAGFAALILTSAIYALIVSAVDPAFAAIINQISELSMNGDIDSMTVLLEDPSIVNYMVTCHITMTFASLAMALRHMQIHEINVAVRSHMKSGAPGGLNQLFLNWYRESKYEVRPLMAHPSWIGYIALIFGNLVGLIIGFLIFGYNVQMTAFGVIFSLIGISFYLPYLCRYTNMVAFKYAVRMQEIALADAESNLFVLRQQGVVNDSEYEEMNKTIEEARAQIEEEKKNQPERYPFED